MIDTDNSGQITFEELKAGLERFGANLNESEIRQLMQAVSTLIILENQIPYFLMNKLHMKISNTVHCHYKASI